MKKKVVKLIFDIKLSVFILLAKAKIAFMRRDITEFDKFGIKEVNLAALETLVNALQALPTDEELLGDQTLATEQKDALEEPLREKIRDIMTRAKNKYGEGSARYRKFGVTDISQQEGGPLIFTAGRVKRVATSLLTDLASEGLTQDHIDALDDNTTAYDQKFGEKEDAISARDVATEDRAEKANAIYRLLVKYCETGKRIWVGKNEAKYNDYIIYDTPSGEPEEETPPKA